MFRCNSWAVAATFFMAFSLNVPHMQGEQVNDWDEAFRFQCDDGWFIRGQISDYSNVYQDRLFGLVCRRIILYQCDTTPACQELWTEWTNEFEGYQTYTCPGNGYVAGMRSRHEDDYQDRRFSFKCCEIPGASLSDCYATEYQNEYEASVSFAVEYGEVLTGMRSTFSHQAKDRRFAFHACKISCNN